MFIIVLFVFIFLIRIINNKNIHTSNVLSVLKTKMIEKENQDVIKDKITEIEKTQKEINNYFVDKGNIDLFVEGLENIGLSNGSYLSVESIDISEKDKNTINIKLFIGGDFEQVMKTLFSLENYPYSVVIDSIYLNKNNQVVNTTNQEKIYPWTAEVSLSVLSIN